MEVLQYVNTWRCYSMSTHGGVTVCQRMEVLQYVNTWRCYSMSTHGGVTVCQHMEVLQYVNTWRCYSMSTHGDTALFDIRFLPMSSFFSPCHFWNLFNTPFHVRTFFMCVYLYLVCTCHYIHLFWHRFFIDISFDISPIHHPIHQSIYESLHVFIHLFCRCVGLFWHPFPPYISFDIFPIDHVTIWIKFCVYRSLLSACRSLLVSMHVSFSQHADLFLSVCRSIFVSIQASFGDHVGVSVCWYLSVRMFWMASRMQAYL